MKQKQTVLILGGSAGSLINFRSDLIRDLFEAGHNIILMSPKPDNDLQSAALTDLPARHISYPLARNGLNPLSDMRCFFALLRVFWKQKPDIVFAYNIKPVIWGGLALRLVSKRSRFSVLIEGMGFAFQDRSGWRGLLKKLVAALSRSALQRAHCVIFLNPESKNDFVDNGIASEKESVLIDGIGVDLSKFSFQPTPSGTPIFLCVSRLLTEKGLRQYAQAAKIVKEQVDDVRFLLLGPEDSSPDALPLAEVNQWQNDGSIEYLGQTDDVRSVLANCHVFVLPSYHEGMPRSIMEAMAVGRAVLTTNIPGCRAMVSPGDNGFLVPPRDPQALAERMFWFIENRHRWQSMGQASRKIAENRFDVAMINRQFMACILAGHQSNDKTDNDKKATGE